MLLPYNEIVIYSQTRKNWGIDISTSYTFNQASFGPFEEQFVPTGNSFHN